MTTLPWFVNSFCCLSLINLWFVCTRWCKDLTHSLNISPRSGVWSIDSKFTTAVTDDGHFTPCLGSLILIEGLFWAIFGVEKFCEESDSLYVLFQQPTVSAGLVFGGLLLEQETLFPWSCLLTRSPKKKPHVHKCNHKLSQAMLGKTSTYASKSHNNLPLSWSCLLLLGAPSKN